MTSTTGDTPSGAEQRPLLVALHGWLLAGRLWDPLIQELAPDWQVWAPDLPGFGLRERPRGLQPSLAAYGRWVAEQCLERLPSGRSVVLLGHSLGGSIATHAASTLGDRLAGLVQIAAGGGVYQPRAFQQVRRGGAAFIRWRPRWLLALPGSDPLRSPLLAERHAARGLLACSLRRSAVEQLPQLTAALTVPSLWIAGSRDTVMAPRYVRHLAGYAPNHQLRLLEGVGHLPMRQQPAQLAAVLREWLESGLIEDRLIEGRLLKGSGGDQSAASPRSCSSASRA
jgi:2-succinyl-6-hydroxy-2,4-cyclohexadiene-1-carboxylate synthase